MKTIILYYSYTGHTKALAQSQAQGESADIVGIKDTARPGVLKAYTAGCFAAMRGKAWPIKALDADLGAYDRLVLFFPIWAGNPPPAVHAVLERLPKGKTVALKMISASGRSNCRGKLEAVIEAKGCTAESFEDIKA